MGRVIEVVPHDLAAWRAEFACEASALQHVFGDALVAIHHIGSTSVPGLPAKPIIDLLVVLRETVTIGRFSSAMEAVGYRVRGECLDAEIPGTPGRFYFSKDQDGTRTHHTHACAVGHAEIADKLAFRDYLRAHPRRAAEYGALKQDLARRFHHDNIGYMRGKDAFIRTILEEARQWSREAESLKAAERLMDPSTRAQDSVSSLDPRCLNEIALPHKSKRGPS
jgi:GrpB-like predicted nucleotidyltransferase (UPF0157 family)